MEMERPFRVPIFFFLYFLFFFFWLFYVFSILLLFLYFVPICPHDSLLLWIFCSRLRSDGMPWNVIFVIRNEKWALLSVTCIQCILCSVHISGQYRDDDLSSHWVVLWFDHCFCLPITKSIKPLWKIDFDLWSLVQLQCVYWSINHSLGQSNRKKNSNKPEPMHHTTFRIWFSVSCFKSTFFSNSFGFLLQTLFSHYIHRVWIMVQVECLV